MADLQDAIMALLRQVSADVAAIKARVIPDPHAPNPFTGTGKPLETEKPADEYPLRFVAPLALPLEDWKTVKNPAALSAARRASLDKPTVARVVPIGTEGTPAPISTQAICELFDARTLWHRFVELGMDANARLEELTLAGSFRYDWGNETRRVFVIVGKDNKLNCAEWLLRYATSAAEVVDAQAEVDLRSMGMIG